MPDLFNVKTNRPESIDEPEALQKALATKSHSFKVGEKIPAINPYGEKVWIKSDEVHQKVGQGYKIPTNNEIEIEKFVDENSGTMGAIGVGASQFVNQLGLGLPHLIRDKTGSDLEVAKHRALEQEHSFANLAGGVGGFAGSLFAPGPAHLFRGASAAGKAATAQIAARLGVSAGEDIGKRSITKAAKEIAARMGGMGVEGAAIAAPHAITETMLGDPKAAGEHLLAGAGIGLAFGGGAELFRLGKHVKKTIVDSEKLRAGNVKKYARQLAEVWTGVPEERFETYLNNSERINNAKPSEQLFREVDEVVSSVKNEVDELKVLTKEKEQELNQSYANARRDLSQAKIPQVVADEIDISLQGLKGKIGELSGHTDDILAAVPGKGLPLDFMINLTDDAIKEFVPIFVGEKAKAVSAKLTSLKNDLKAFNTGSSKEWNPLYHGTMPDSQQFIAYPTVRDVIQQVRESIDWSPAAAEFNTRLNKAYMAFTEKLSNRVKKDSPKYAEMMEEMSFLSKTHSEMEKYGFTKRALGASKLEKIVKSGDEIGSKLISKYDQIMGTNFTKELNKHLLNKRILEKSSRGDLRRVLNPRQYEELAILKQKLAHAENVYKPMSPLSTERIQAAMANLDRKKPNFNTVDAFKYLDTFYKPGTSEKYNFLQEIEDRNILDMFLKQDKAGSRKTNLSTVVSGGLASLLGLSAAGPIGAVAGAIGGATLDIYGGKILKGLVDKNPNVAGLLFVEKKMAQNAEKIEKIPSLFERMSAKNPIKVKPSTGAISALWRVLEETKKDDQTSNHKMKESASKISEISERVSSLLSNPHLMHEHLSELTEGLHLGGAPEIANSFASTIQEVLQYIDAIIPKPPVPYSPFERSVKWNPPDYQIFAFAQKLQVLENPFMVLDALENGTLTSNHMEALQTVFPSIYKEIQNRALEVAASGVEIAMDYDKIVKLSMLLDVPLDSSLSRENINYLQASFTAQAQQNAYGNSGKPVDIANAQLTQAQSLQTPRG